MSDGIVIRGLKAFGLLRSKSETNPLVVAEKFVSSMLHRNLRLVKNKPNQRRVTITFEYKCRSFFTETYVKEVRFIALSNTTSFPVEIWTHGTELEGWNHAADAENEYELLLWLNRMKAWHSAALKEAFDCCPASAISPPCRG